MKIQINLKLKLTKQKKTIKVSYHTFETATFDEYLAASLALKATSYEEAQRYISDITGEGSLNAHFINRYQEMCKLSEEELQSVLSNSRVPTLKIDSSNWYDYYPALDVSIYKKHAYNGDLGYYPNIIQILHINEEVVEKSVDEGRSLDRPETYLVRLTDDNISIKMFDDWVSIPSSVFEQSLVNEVKSVQNYAGTVHNEVMGEGWYVLSTTKLNNMLLSSDSFIDDEGNHCAIRNADIRKTTLAQISGLFIYKETMVAYEGNPALCKKVLSIITTNATVKKSGVKMILLLLRNVDQHFAQQFINFNYGEMYFPKEIAELVITMIRMGLTDKWNKRILKEVLKQCDSSAYAILYRLDGTLPFTIEQLIVLDPTILTDEHKQKVVTYLNNLNKMKDTIRQIIGEITTSGLRERMKVLTADSETRRFTKLCNDLIGHVKTDLEKANKDNTEHWLQMAIELKELSEVIKKRLPDNQ